MTTDEPIHVESVNTCILCQEEGTTLYESMTDRLFSVPGTWGFLRCPRCGLVWLNPRPIPDELGKVYAQYHTHIAGSKNRRLTTWWRRFETALCTEIPGYETLAEGWGWQKLARLSGKFPLTKDAGFLGTMCLDGTLKKGRLLDVGCGSGDFLVRMKKAGWDVHGIEPDPEAVRVAHAKLGDCVLLGTVDHSSLGEGSFDAVTLHHVVEHAYDPIGLLRRCGRLLKPGGRLALVTPNIDSMGHRLFGQAWRGLEPPRHIHLFSIRTLRKLAALSRLEVKVLRTSSRSAHWIWTASNAIRMGGSSKPRLWQKARGLAFQVREERSRRISEEVGEEVLLLAGTSS